MLFDLSSKKNLEDEAQLKTFADTLENYFYRRNVLHEFCIDYRILLTSSVLLCFCRDYLCIRCRRFCRSFCNKVSVHLVYSIGSISHRAMEHN